MRRINIANRCLLIQKTNHTGQPLDKIQLKPYTIIIKFFIVLYQ